MISRGYNPLMQNSMKNQTSETPDTSILAFNSKYDVVSDVDIKNKSDESKFDEHYNDMAENIWRICFYILNGSPKKNLLAKKLKFVFENSENARFDLGGGIFVVVKYPSISTNRLSFKIGEKSTFQYGHLNFEVLGNPKISTQDGEKLVIDRLKYLHEILKDKFSD